MYNSQGKSTTNTLAGLLIFSIVSGVTLPKGIEIIENAYKVTSDYNVKVIQNQVDIYKLMEGEYPLSLESLVEKGYLRNLPEKLDYIDENIIISYDPFTGEVYLE